MRRLASVFSSIALLAICAPPVVGASPTAVDCTNDPSALQAAAATASPRSTLLIRGTCVGVVDIDTDLTIKPSTPDARLTSDPDDSVLDVGAGATVLIKGLTISGASRAPGRVQLLNHGSLTLIDSIVTDGGINAIRNFGTLTLRDSAVTDNRGMGDVPIDNVGGTVTLIRSLVSGNSNTEVSGAIGNSSGGTFTLIQSTVSGNNGFFSVVTNAGTMTFTDSTVAGNQSIYAAVVNGNGGTMSFTRSTVSDNTTGGALCGACGGGIHNAGTLLLRHSIVRANVTRSNGGGIYNVGTATLEHSQVVSNTATDGGGVFNLGSITLRKVTIADNLPDDCVGCPQ